jgi:hypothetical protein
MKRCLKRALLAFVLLTALAAGSASAAEEAGADQPAVSFRAAVQAGSADLIEVTWFALDAVDVYAYELEIGYDAERLALQETEVSVQGFTVPPIETEGRVRIAHTMVGPVKGMDGTIALATLRFARIAPGDAAVTLLEAKLVDSAIVSVSYTPQLEHKLADPAARLHDIDGHWAQAAIEEGVRIGFINGYPDASFRPDNRVTRAEFATMLVRALQRPLPHEGAPSFADADQLPEWAASYAAAAVHAGWIEGFEDGSFRAEAELTRAEMAAMLVRAMGASPSPHAADFADWEDMPVRAGGYAAAAYEAGIMQGKPNRRFDPLAPVTRAEAAVAILRLRQLN